MESYFSCSLRLCCCVGILWKRAEDSVTNMKYKSEEAADIFKKLFQFPKPEADDDIKTLDKLSVIVYDKSSTAGVFYDA